jgi:hypothetical protein
MLPDFLAATGSMTDACAAAAPNYAAALAPLQSPAAPPQHLWHAVVTPGTRPSLPARLPASETAAGAQALWPSASGETVHVTHRSTTTLQGLARWQSTPPGPSLTQQAPAAAVRHVQRKAAAAGGRRVRGSSMETQRRQVQLSAAWVVLSSSRSWGTCRRSRLSAAQHAHARYPGLVAAALS